MDAVNLEEIFSRPRGTVREPPRWFRAQLRKAFALAMSEWQRSGRAGAWKLFLLVPRMLLQPTELQGEAGKVTFHDRMRRFLRGDWEGLLKDDSPARIGPQGRTADPNEERSRLRRAEAKIRLKEISRARIELTSTGLAPGNEDTYKELTDPELRPPEPSEAIPERCLTFTPQHSVQLDPHVLMESLRAAGRGSAQDLGGML